MRMRRLARALPWPSARRGQARLSGVCAALLASLFLWLLPTLTGSLPLLSATARLVPSNASCAQLAHADPSATNGALWGTTIEVGFGRAGGWFGVPVCANGINLAAPGGSNVSCDHAPANLAATGCAPGEATSDGYGLTFQCVELVARFSAWAFDDSSGGWRGDAPFLWLSGHHPRDFTAYANGGDHAPQPGDILIWGTLDSHGNPWPAGPAGGHAAVVAAVGDGSITFVEENMLGHRDGAAINIPSETTTLTQSATGQWTTGPTYGVNGGRALYGWLHSSRNSGHFPGAGKASATVAPGVASALTPTPSPSSTPAPAAPPEPSLAQGVIVTGSGALAESVWSDTRSPAGLAAQAPLEAATPTPATTGAATSVSSAASSAAPHLQIESLGAPPAAALAPDQTPAVVTLPTGERYIFARGQSGDLVAAYTPAGQPDVAWQTLGAPPGVALTGSVTSVWDGKGMLVGALGDDGAFWVRAGPAGMLGEWTSLGHPPATAFQGSPVALTVSTATSISRQALAIGRDGRLYAASWSATGGVGSQGPGASANWSAWAPVSLSGAVSPLQGALLLATGQTTDQAGGVYLLASGAGGRLWALHRASLSATSATSAAWDARQLPQPGATGAYRALAAALTAPAPSNSPARPQTLQVYLVAESQGSGGTPSATGGAASASTSTADAANKPALLGVIPLAGTSGADAVTWEPIDTPRSSAGTSSTPAGADTLGSAVALSLGPGQSALLAAQGDAVTLLGETASVRLLAPDAASPAINAPKTERLVIGEAPGPAAFSDAFAGSGLDPRWLVTTFSSSADGLALATSPTSAAQAPQITRGALTLSTSTAAASAPASATAPAGNGMVAALQGASGKDGSVTTRVTPGTGWASDATTAGQKQAGILLRLDDWNRVTLALRGDDTVAFCAAAGTDEPQCSVMFLPPSAASSQGISLRLILIGATLTGLMSADGQRWTQVGAWTLPWLPGPGEISGPYAPPANAATGAATSDSASVWLGFTSAGLFVANAGVAQLSTSSTTSNKAASAPLSAQFSAFTVDAGA